MWHPDLPEEYRDQIVTGDARELAKAIPDESVDLIFTDPPYPQEFLPLYGWLANEANRVLKPGGLCMAMAGQSYLPDVYGQMARHLTYHWTFLLETPGQASNLWTRRLGSNWKPIISWSKGIYIGPHWGTDVIRSGMNDKRYHSWGQSETSAFFVLLKFPDAVVWEPFTGGGTVPAVCKMLGRHYVAFEIDPTTAERARQRVANTQSPLPGLVYEQEALAL